MEEIIEELFEAVYNLKYYIDVQKVPLRHLGERVDESAGYKNASDLLERKDELNAQINREMSDLSFGS